MIHFVQLFNDICLHDPAVVCSSVDKAVVRALKNSSSLIVGIMTLNLNWICSCQKWKHVLHKMWRLCTIFQKAHLTVKKIGSPSAWLIHITLSFRGK